MFDQNAFEVRVTEHHRRVADVEKHAWKVQPEHGESRTRLSEHVVTYARRASAPAAAVGAVALALFAR